VSVSCVQRVAQPVDAVNLQTDSARNRAEVEEASWFGSEEIDLLAVVQTFSAHFRPGRIGNACRRKGRRCISPWIKWTLTRLAHDACRGRRPRCFHHSPRPACTSPSYGRITPHPRARPE